MHLVQKKITMENRCDDFRTVSIVFPRKSNQISVRRKSVAGKHRKMEVHLLDPGAVFEEKLKPLLTKDFPKLTYVKQIKNRSIRPPLLPLFKNGDYVRKCFLDGDADRKGKELSSILLCKPNEQKEITETVSHLQDLKGDRSNSCPLGSFLRGQDLPRVVTAQKRQLCDSARKQQNHSQKVSDTCSIGSQAVSEVRTQRGCSKCDSDRGVTLGDSHDWHPREYGCTMSEGDVELIKNSVWEGIDLDYFEDYGINDFYALSIKSSGTLQCNPSDVIIGHDVHLQHYDVSLSGNQELFSGAQNLRTSKLSSLILRF